MIKFVKKQKIKKYNIMIIIFFNVLALNFTNEVAEFKVNLIHHYLKVLTKN